MKKADCACVVCRIVTRALWGAMLISGVLAVLAVLAVAAHGQTVVYCQPDVIKAMKHIWNESGNGMTGVEASFMLNGTPENYRIEQEKMTGEHDEQAVVIYPGQTFALFHVHPNNSGQYPSTPSNHYGTEGHGDTYLADKYHLDIYVVHQRGLSVYRWKTKETVLLRQGMDWGSEKGCF